MAFVVAFELPMLFTLLFFALITRLFFLWVVQGDWPFPKMDLAMYVLSFFARRFDRAFQEQEAIDVDPNLSWDSFNNSVHTNCTPQINKKASSKLILAQFLRIGFQQLKNPFTKRSTRITLRVYALASAVSKILVTFWGHLCYR